MTANTNGVGVDCLTADGPVHLIVIAGDIDTANADETYAFKLQESDDNSTFSDVTGATTTITADKTSSIISTGYQRTKRYVRAVLTVGGTTPSILCAAYVMFRKKITGSGAGVQL